MANNQNNFDPTALIIGGASIAANAGIQAGQNKKSRKWASEEAEKAYRRNLEQWERENAYNDPSAKMARLKAAGLNPNLAYGNPQTAGVSAKSPQKQAPQGKYGIDVDPLSMANASLLQQQARSVQLANMKEEIDLGLRDPEYFTNTVEIMGSDGEWKVFTNSDTKNMYYQRTRDKTKISGYDTEVKELEAKLASEGFVKGDNAAIRFIATALKEAGISPNQITTQIVNSILSKLGFSTK